MCILRFGQRGLEESEALVRGCEAGIKLLRLLPEMPDLMIALLEGGLGNA